MFALQRMSSSFCFIIWNSDPLQSCSANPLTPCPIWKGLLEDEKRCSRTVRCRLLVRLRVRLRVEATVVCVLTTGGSAENEFANLYPRAASGVYLTAFSKSLIYLPDGRALLRTGSLCGISTPAGTPLGRSHSRLAP